MANEDNPLEILAHFPIGTTAVRRLLNAPGLFTNKRYWRRVEAPAQPARSPTGAQPVRTPTATASGEMPTNTPPSTSPSMPSLIRGANAAAPDWIRRQWRDDGPADHNLGSGPYRVYAWCNKNDVGEKERWPVKIGHTGSGGLKARLDKAQMQEHPRYLMCVRFDKKSDAQMMERALHTCLHFRGRRHSDAPGQEWVRTHTQELLQRVVSIDPGLTLWREPEKPS